MTYTAEIEFLQEFRVGTGRAGDLADEKVDPVNPFPGSSLKGVLRAEARCLLPGAGDQDHPFLVSVFGSPRSPSPWNFGCSVADVKVGLRASIRVGERDHVEDGALGMRETVVAHRGVVSIHQHGVASGRGLPTSLEKEALNCHVALLNVALLLLEKVGQSKSRPLGWVGSSGLEGRDPGADARVVHRIGKGE